MGAKVMTNESPVPRVLGGGRCWEDDQEGTGLASWLTSWVLAQGPASGAMLCCPALKSLIICQNWCWS